MIMSEKNKATMTASADCSNAVGLATKRLNARGCGSLISAATDGSNTNPGAPTDGSCSIYHPNGGGVKGCGYILPPIDCTTVAIGATCGTDNAIYIGDSGGNRLYAAPTDESGTMLWSTENIVTGATSTSNGLSNTNNATIVSKGAAIYPAIWACRNKAPIGTWYLPSKDEILVIWTNRVAIDLVAKGFDVTLPTCIYSTSSEFSATQQWAQILDGGLPGAGPKTTNPRRVRCIRR